MNLYLRLSFVLLTLALAAPALAAAPAWTPIGPFGGPVYAIVPDPRDAATVYALVDGGERIYRSVDHGVSWSGITRGLPPGAGASALAIDSRQPKTLYLASAGLLPGVLYAGGFVPAIGLGNSEPLLYKRSDGGASWTRIVGDDTPAPQKLLVSPVSSAVVYAAEGSRLYRSDDGGLHWSQVATAPQEGQITDLLAAPDGTLFAATSNTGVYTSPDGLTWTALDPAGLESLDILDLALDPARPDLLYAGTASAGIETHTAPR